MRTITLLTALCLLAAAPAQAQSCGGTGLDADCDADSFTLATGDCDDSNPDIHPGVRELCGDQADNNCNGLFDEECDDAASLGSIRGGGGCTGGSGVGGAAWVFLAPWWLIFRGRRS